MISQLAPAGDQVTLPAGLEATSASGVPKKRAPLRLRPVDRAEMSWSEHSYAARELASILTFELTVLDEAVRTDVCDPDAGTDSPAGSGRVVALHSAGTAVS